eukprot:TRINITY_DN103618_c0_g1_i1.p1 TRINITY_DN103618_c0_g1~~TRINITY_DN103618_c0_g1_i1.p1  ORF type:complete len:329 (+),score=86.15 TRINITY_DN103618_c0_g1_i1:56-988(+)
MAADRLVAFGSSALMAAGVVGCAVSGSAFVSTPGSAPRSSLSSHDATAAASTGLASPAWPASALGTEHRVAISGAAGVLVAAWGAAGRRSGNKPRRRGAKAAGGETEAATATEEDKDADEEEGEAEEAEEEAATKLAKRPKRPPRIPFNPKEQVGITMPFGYFDPLGLCPPGDEGKFRQYRSAEIKHGRVAMLATVGFVAQHYFRLPGGFDFGPGGIQAPWVVPSAWPTWGLLLPFTAIMELIFWKQSPRKEAGDFGDPFGFNMYNEDMRNREINNGRAAMFAAMGIIVAEMATGKDGIQQLQAVGLLSV